MTPTVEINHYDLRIMIGGLPCVYILRKEFVGFHAWEDDQSMLVIEFTTKTNKIRTEWDTKEKWTSILKALNEAL